MPSGAQALCLILGAQALCLILGVQALCLILRVQALCLILGYRPCVCNAPGFPGKPASPDREALQHDKSRLRPNPSLTTPSLSPWASYTSSLCLSFLICKVGIIRAPTS